MEEIVTQQKEKSPKKSLSRPMRLALAAAGGVFIGIANGLFGGGGGMLVVPLLSLLLKMEEKEAHATAIAVILPLSLISGIIYCVKGAFVLDIGVPCSIGIVLGGIAGAFCLNKINNKALTVLFYGIMIVAGIKMIL